ncbi:DUF6069 family protein [Kutzneria buriramensis]|uniref:Uncharacterized protein n=1 Tax=Kutzneria buriramensis TaxID=1045776 RepID=A0A3E0HDU1_9PSEU|nr:DUF6069 family protein [Kutzneria buriramensis]REH42909.1 hypothetical protein BCF44_110414 [Kutzneria buriramensis]
MTITTSAAAVRPTSATRRRLRRAGSVLAAAAAAGVVSLVGSAVGVDFLLSDSMGAVVISLPIVLIFGTAFGVLGWAALAVLERFTAKARAIWTGLAVAVLALSLPPIFLEDATAGTKIGLVLVHGAVAAVLIPLMRRK